MTEHGNFRVVRQKAQTYIGKCDCGWIGVGPRSKRPYWLSVEAAFAAMKHARENGVTITLSDVAKVDLQPESSRGAF